MSVPGQKRFTAAVATGAALLLGAALAQPAAAVDLPHSAVAYFAADADLTGARFTVDTGAGCHNLPAAAKSAVNFTTANVTVYFNADCRTGAPGRTGDLAYGLGSLHWANFPYQALSYRVTG